MKYTYAQLKRDADSGKMYLTMLYRYGDTGDAITERLRGMRSVIRSASFGLVLLNADGAESDLRIPAATLIDYDGATLTVYEAGKRPLTEDEQREKERIDADMREYERKNPYSESYWHFKSVCEKSKYPYLDGFGKKHGKKYRAYNNTIIDDAIKGDAILRYAVTFCE